MMKITTLFPMVLLVLCMGLTSCDDVIVMPDPNVRFLSL
jgi:hypothetical protein